MEHKDRHGRDAAGVGPYAREREHLVALKTLDSWKVSDGEPDIRAWDVQTVSGRPLGSVSDLLIDPNAGEVVLLDIDLPGSDRHTFVPIRVVQIDRARRVILMDSADLPDSDFTPPARVVAADRRDLNPQVVRYPTADREVVVERPAIADAAVVRDDDLPLDVMDDPALSERRRAERRRIERPSTDF